MNEYQMTHEALKELQDELDQLKTVGRAEMAEKIKVYRVRMVEIMVSLFLFSEVAEILVVRVLWYYDNSVLETFCDCLDHCGLA